ncbi:TPA: B12-binding domain-containing radical SAM protein [Candidatus Bathyarchaeota archaeon]|nr:B12-binding domain-containing radical SAM protein [Candidatus Bathyarchaeota archaeon]
MSQSNDGYPIVLTADRTLMSEYGGGVFLGFSACVPRGLVPDKIYFSIFCPPIEVDEKGSPAVAPYGTRKIEAALINYGFDETDIFVAHPDHLDMAIGPKTKVIGITENDPLGIGPATSTFTQIFGGEAYMAIKFKELLNDPAIKKFKPKIIVGGPGAWQLKDSYIRRSMGIDCIVIGEGEKVVGPLFEKALSGDSLPEIVYGKIVNVNEIPTIRGATINGLVEIARGCGRGCAFCTPTMLRYRCLPIDHILKEVEVNIRAGRQPLLHAEDVLRYGAKGIKVNKKAVIKLFKSVKNFNGVKNINISHFALSSVVDAPEVIEEISSIVGANDEHWMSGQTGIETGSPHLIRKLMIGKCKPFSPEDWPHVVVRAFEILSENYWVPCGTLILGLPGETEHDIDLTISLVQELRSFKSLIVPLFLVAMGGIENKARSFSLKDMTLKHSELILKCWKHNLEWLPTLLKEWGQMAIKNRILRYSVTHLLSYGAKKTMKLIRLCETEYNYDIVEMINDFRSGRGIVPLPARILKPFLRVI